MFYLEVHAEGKRVVPFGLFASG
jgi:hypothetical protein